MKICYLADVNNYHTEKWARYFVNKGHEVVIISLSKGQIEGCKVYDFNYRNVKKLSTIKKLSYLVFVSKIKKIIKNEKPDVVHAHYASSYGLISKLVGFNPTIVSLWGSDILLFPKKSFLHKFIIKKILNANNYLFSTSEYMIKEANKYLKKTKTIYLTPFGVDINKFQSLKGTKDNQRFVIGINKSLEDISGIDILLKALHQLKQKAEELDIELRIAGKGSQYNYLKKVVYQLKLVENVKFYGFLNQSEVITFLQSLDVAVYPSRSESFGVSAIEAQACGIPVIASNVDGFKESTIPGETALLFKKEDVSDLIKKIRFLYENREKLAYS